MTLTVSPAPLRAPPTKPRGFPWVGVSFLLLFLLALLAGAGAILAVLMPGPATERQTIIIPHQSGLRGIGTVLAENGQILHPLVFILPAKLMSEDKLQTGEYEFPPALSVVDIIALLRAGKTVTHKITIPEGLTNAAVGKLLEGEALLSETLRDLPSEGLLFPATYHYKYGDSRNALTAQMRQMAQETLNALWSKRVPNLPLATPEQALTLASIIEKETGVPTERRRVAGVFINRLRKGMKLQSDPTVIFALTQGKAPLGRSLTGTDLAFLSPYNTYAVVGLPPGPIANPGRAALEAALQPETHDLLYFVADGTGGHAFAKTLDEHNRNVAAWRKLRQ